ncbi:hypothetical protein Ae201684P_019069 [Aphanomyces euteiches]|nr:hypothetical protein Ae201684P_019069 [Aphanomyces euteiches]
MSFKVDEDWEEWTPEKGSFLNHMIAGSAAGVVEHCSIFPIDTIKTHMQCQRCPVNNGAIQMSAFQTASKLIAQDGPMRLFRGVSTMLGASLPAHALYFSVFEACKKAFGADSPDHTPIQSGAAGVIATVTHDLVMTPMDVIKQRLQLGYYSGVFDCMKTMIRTEGLHALYISFPTTLFMNLPYSMIMVTTNESMKKLLNPSGEINVGAYVMSGVIAGWRSDESFGCGQDSTSNPITPARRNPHLWWKGGWRKELRPAVAQERRTKDAIQRPG